jgi:hypothetical protein
MNWGEIKSAVIELSHRDDLTALLPLFLKLAEQRIYYGELNAPKVRCAAMRQFATLANGTQPTGYLEAIKVAPNGKPEWPLTYKPMEQMPDAWEAFSWDGQTLVLSTEQAFPIDLTYYAKLATPVADTDENWVMANAPNIYIASLLVEVGRRGMDDELAAREANNYASSVNALTSHEKAAAISGSRLVMKGR